MRAVNLLPPDSYAPRRRLPHARVVLGAFLPVLAGAVVYLGWSLEHAKVVDDRNALGAVQASIAALRPSQALADEASRIAAERQPRQAALASALGKQLPWDVALGQISRVLPSDVWLSSLSAQSPTPAASTAPSAGSPTGFTIQGFTFSHDSVARLLERLALVPSLGNVALASTASSEIGKRSVVQFQITAAMQAPHPALPEVAR